MNANADKTKFFKHIEKFRARLFEKKKSYEQIGDTKTVETLNHIIQDMDKAVSEHNDGKKLFDELYAEIASLYLYAEIHIDMIEQHK